MKIVFAAGDVGGARALLPVARLAAEQKHQVIALAHGVLFEEGEEEWQWSNFDKINQDEYWDMNRPDVIFYATSVNDTRAMTVARKAMQKGCKAVHVLDNWSSYSERLRDNEGLPLIPDIYAVMDDLAFEEAVMAGVPKYILRVVGHPNLSKLQEERDGFGRESSQTGLSVLFVSEPAEKDSGNSESPKFRGYSETEVASIVVNSLAANRSQLKRINTLDIVPHPRENREQVAQNWSQLMAASGSELIENLFNMVPPNKVRYHLHSSDIVIGMTSILLYEAWLLGKTVISLQPNLRLPEFRALQKREGLLFFDNPSAFQDKFPSIINTVGRVRTEINEDARNHSNAAQSFLDIAARLAN